MTTSLSVAFLQTLYITIFVSILVFIIGLSLGILLFMFREKTLLFGIKRYKFLSNVINVLRSIPFIILLIILMPFTNFLIGKITGANASIPALVLSVAPLFARLVENTLVDLDPSLLELRIVLKLTKLQLFKNVILKEAMPAILGNFTSVIIATIGYSAMAGVIGAGGLGSYAYTYGFQRNDSQAVISSTVLILLLVVLVEFINKKVIKKIDYR